MSLKKNSSPFDTDSLSKVFKNIPYSCAIGDEKGYLVWANESWGRMWGIPQEVVENELIGKYSPLNDPQVKELGILEAMLLTLKGETVTLPKFQFDPAASARPGETRWLEATLNPIFVKGKVKYVVMTYLDLTENTNFELRLENNLQSQRLLSEASSILASERDLKKSFEKVAVLSTQAPYELCLITLESKALGSLRILAGKDGVLEGKIKRRLLKQLDNIENSKNQNVLLAEGPIRLKGKIQGSYLLIDRTSTMPREGNDDLSAIRFLANEVADRLSLAAENFLLLNKLNSEIQLRESFITLASHELKTPLSSLRLAIDFLNSNFSKDWRVSSADHDINSNLAKTTRTQAETMVHLVNDMLDVTKIQSGTLSVIFSKYMLKEQFHEVLNRYKFASHFQNLIMDVDDVEVVWDKKRIEQVLVNLIENAVKYANQSVLKLIARRVDSRVDIIVADNGPGIGADRIDQIFDRFSRATTSRSISGMGIGLYIVKSIIEAHGGNIVVESEEGEGTKFTASLPINPTLEI